MVNVNEDQVDSTSEASSTEKKQDLVSYESFRKSVSAEKAARERAQTLEAELEARDQAKLEAEGKHQEIIDGLRNKLTQTETTLTKERETNLWNNVTGAVKSEAVKHGCLNPDKLIKLFDKSDFSMLQADGGSIRQDSLAALMEKAKKENDFLFKQAPMKINDAVPSGNPSKPSRKDVKDMSSAERLQALKDSLGQVIK